jgi:putative transposase
VNGNEKCRGDACVASRRHRNSLRLHGWDYRTPTVYFVTIVTHARAQFLGTVRDEVVKLSPLGNLAEEEWIRSAGRRPGTELDLFVVMPNHLHGIVWLDPPGESVTPGPGPAPGSLSAFIGGFKAASSRRIKQVISLPLGRVWQRNYHDRVIRNDKELEALRAYIDDNPRRWSEDRENPEWVPAQGDARVAPTKPGE